MRGQKIAYFPVGVARWRTDSERPLGLYLGLMFNKIVVGYEGEQAGRDAVKLAAKLAAVSGSEITVVYPYHPLFARAPFDVVEADVRRDVGQLLSGLEGLRELTFHSSSSTWPIHAMQELASYEDADLVVFGAAREGLVKHLHASVVERMVHGAPCAVAVSPAGYADAENGEIRRIGVGFSDTHEGTAAVYLAHELATLVRGELELIAAAGVSASEAAYAASAGLLSKLEDDVFAEAREKVEQLVGALGEGVPLSVELERDDPCRLLIERTGSLDLLVLGSRAYGPFRCALLGSVSAGVIARAQCPAVVLPRGARRCASEPSREGSEVALRADHVAS
jgi:nucleotide-binding universal stress UspA family protein